MVVCFRSKLITNSYIHQALLLLMKKHLELTPWYHVTAFDSGWGLALTSHDKRTSSPSLTVPRSILDSSWTVTAGGSAKKKTIQKEYIRIYLHKQMKSINIRWAHPGQNEMELLLLLKHRYSWESYTLRSTPPSTIREAWALRNVHGNNTDCVQYTCVCLGRIVMKCGWILGSLYPH
jgi:hypothetical protein